jgi:hypothetical protein
VLSIRGRLRGIVLLAALPPGCLFAEDVVTVAVASNFAKTAAEISAAFTQESGVSVRISRRSMFFLRPTQSVHCCWSNPVLS